MMSKKAVDVVLLPDDEAMDSIIELNGRLVSKFGGGIVLGRQTSLPHISLAMGCIDDGDIAAVGEILRKIADEDFPRELRITGVKVNESSNGEKISSLEIEKTENLRHLHEVITERIGIYFTYDVTDDMIYPSGRVADSSLRWIREYRTKSSFENFWPHITLGFGEIDDMEFAGTLKVSKLASCHLGNRCTCRKILTEAEI